MRIIRIYANRLFFRDKRLISVIRIKNTSGTIFISLIFIVQGLVAGGEEVANGVGYAHEGAGGVHGHVGGQAVAHGDGVDKS